MNLDRYPISALRWSVASVAILLAGCVTVGPDFTPPQTHSPADWNSRPTSAPAQSAMLAPSTDRLPSTWWKVFADPVLDTLQTRAIASNPDMQTATLRFAQSRLQRRITASQSTPQVALDAQVTRRRQSEEASETKLVNAVGGSNAPALINLLSEPDTLYQAGFDVSWELDLWGRVRRSIEAADAQVETANAQLQDAQLVLSSELTRAYFELRQLQRQQALLAREQAIAKELLSLRQAQARNGLSDQEPPLTQGQALASLDAQQAVLQAQQAAAVNQIGLLTGDAPGALNGLLAPVHTDIDDDAPVTLPTLALGQPSDLLSHRPDVRAAEARLHAVTAEIGVATADLYPRIALGASAGYQSIVGSEFGQWGSRMWQIGPTLSLPIFDHGRRRANVELHRKDQQVAAIAWHQSVLKAWQEVDDALTAQATERQRNQHLRERARASREQWNFALARANNGLTSTLTPLQAELTWRQSLTELSESDTRLRTSMVAIYKAVGGGNEQVLTWPTP